MSPDLAQMDNIPHYIIFGISAILMLISVVVFVVSGRKHIYNIIVCWKTIHETEEQIVQETPKEQTQQAPQEQIVQATDERTVKATDEESESAAIWAFFIIAPIWQMISIFIMAINAWKPRYIGFNNLSFLFSKYATVKINMKRIVLYFSSFKQFQQHYFCVGLS